MSVQSIQKLESKFKIKLFSVGKSVKVMSGLLLHDFMPTFSAVFYLKTQILTGATKGTSPSGTSPPLWSS